MEFSVVIPTHNRHSRLARTLEALARQSLAADRFEVLVVDDGSTDSTRECVWDRQASFPATLHYLYQPNRKQGAARNLGANQAVGTRLIFLGDDVVPCAGFLEHHSRAAAGAEPETVVIGYTTWPPDYVVTPLLRYVGEEGWQFGFSLIEDPENVPFNYFYTSNLSIDRVFFLESGGFDEAFQEYGWEDIELAHRLKARGMRIVYNREALGHHYHPMTFDGIMRRQHRVGASAWKFYQLHPEMADFLGIADAGRYSVFDHGRLRLMSWACRGAERLRWPDLSRFYSHLMTYFYLQGLRRQQKQEGP